MPRAVFVNDKELPIIEESLTAAEMLEGTSFSPTEYTLYFSDSNNKKGTPVKDGMILKIENNMKMDAVLKPRRHY
jgi:hypothetical protein